MLFGIAVVLLAIVIAVLINKSKIGQMVDKVEEAVAPAVAEVKEVVKKAAEVSPENKIIAKAEVSVGTVVAAVENKKVDKPDPKSGNRAKKNIVEKQNSNNKPKSKK